MNSTEFERQFKRLYLPLGMYALRMLDDTADAEDAVQEAFIKAWSAVDEGAEIANFKAYIYQVVRNVCLSHWRSRRPAEVVDTLPLADEETIDTSERDARLWKAIDRLPQKCREVFLMSKRDGLSNDEIATELGISIKTVKNHLTKALASLRSELEQNRRPFFLPFL